MSMLLVLLLASCAVSDALALSLRDATQHMHSSKSTAGAVEESSSSGRRSSQSEILRLPGWQGDLPSQHFAGYVSVDRSSQRQLFYYLVTRETSPNESFQPRDESTTSPDDSPLIIWLTGGPGCSSLDAYTYENGPFVFSAPAAEAAGREATLRDIQLTQNPHSWSKTAHIVYIDSPAGTGFSYTPGQDSYHTDDDKTIEDLEVFVAGFMQEHPWLSRQPLYIAGESYGGVYVPLLARALLRHNERLKQPGAATTTSSSGWNQLYNLAGYLVGNAVTDGMYDGPGQVDFAFGMGLIDPDTYKDVKRTCKANGWHVGAHSPCANALDVMESTMGPINQYDILGKCFKPTKTLLNPISNPSAATTASPAAAAAAAAAAKMAVSPSNGGATDNNLLTASRKLMQQQHQLEGAGQDKHGGKGLQLSSAVGERCLRTAAQLRHAVSCADRRYALVYFNSPEVRAALHAADERDSGRWEPCSDVLQYTLTYSSMIGVHQELIEGGVRGLVFSGDHDYVVPYTGSRAWVYDMGLRQATPWHSWSISGDDEVAGYAVEFKAGLTFATVKGGGHMVPQTHPQAALSLLRQWMQGRL